MPNENNTQTTTAAPATADQKTTTSTAAPEANATPPAAPAPEGKTYTQAEVDAMIKSEADRRVNQAVGNLTQTKSKVADLEKKLAEQMTEDERKRWELEQREAKLAEAEAQAAAEKRQRLALEEANTRKWPISVARLLEADSPQVVKERAEAIEVVAKAIAADIVQQQMATTGGRPASVGASGTAPGVKITMDQLAGMTSEQVVEAFTSGKLAHLTNGQ